jgi:hypothetical protein
LFEAWLLLSVLIAIVRLGVTQRLQIAPAEGGDDFLR